MLAQNTFPYRGSSAAWAAGSFVLRRGIKMYQESNMLEKASERPNIAAIVDSIF
ncbi:MAG: hypothetical protein ABSD02_24205 [Steroidobacteraceae bacterium]